MAQVEKPKPSRDKKFRYDETNQGLDTEKACGDEANAAKGQRDDKQFRSQPSSKNSK